MREQGSGRVINISSLLGKFSGVGLGWYASTKHAVEGMSDSLRLEVAHLGIEVVKIQPSAVNTNFEAVAFELLGNSNIPEDYKQMISDFKTGLEAFYDQAEGPDGTAETIVEAVESIKPEIAYITAGGEEFLTLRKQMSEEDFYKMISGG
jgi:NAD(P)-dependent dehydrogenase (short-subunit alcohol dehydrogenase family)